LVTDVVTQPAGVKNAVLNDGFPAGVSVCPPTAEGRFESAGVRRSGRPRSEFTQYQHAGRLSRALLTLVAAPAAGLDAGLMALAARTPDDGDRQQPLKTGPPRDRVSRWPGTMLEPAEISANC
jgi:hypothetical protein